MSDPNKIIRQAVKDAQATLAEHGEPDGDKLAPQDCKETINHFLETLDDIDVVQAVNESDLEEENGHAQTYRTRVW